jgi:hypothetical protein
MMACQHGQLEVIQWMLEHPLISPLIDLNKQQLRSSGTNALMEALFHRHLDVFLYLVEKYSEKIDWKVTDLVSLTYLT